VAPKTVNAVLTLPPGFHISTFAEGALESPRWMALASNGDVFVTESQAGRVTVLRDTDNDGRADQRFDFASGLNRPFGLAFWRSYLYVANTNSVVRFKYKPGQEKMIEEPEKVVALPGNGYNQHWTRNVVFSPDGSKQIKAHRLQDHPDTIQQRYPVGGYDDFITGWMMNENSDEVWGRPVGLLVLKDGSMLISDDGAQKIWRVTYSRENK
jgi:glucose/arabinose dehydrogenase